MGTASRDAIASLALGEGSLDAVLIECMALFKSSGVVLWQPRTGFEYMIERALPLAWPLANRPRGQA